MGEIMKGFFKKILCLALVIVALLAGMAYALKPDSPIEDKDRLCNIDERINMYQINKKAIKSIELKKGSAIVCMELNDYEFKQLLKYNILKYGMQNLEAYAFELKGNDILIQIPRKIGPFKSQVDILASLGADKENLLISIKSVKVGKIKIPKSIVDNKLDELIPTGTERLLAENGKIYIKTNNLDFGIEKMHVENGIFKMKFVITKEDVKKLGVEIIDRLFDF